MNSLTPLVGVVVLSGLLTTNFFRAAWQLGMLRAFGRRQPLRWRAVAAGTLAACLPFAGAMLAMMLIPADGGSVHASSLALEFAGSGWAMHLLNDRLIAWGS
jgi:hypothetical protein